MSAQSSEVWPTSEAAVDAADRFIGVIGGLAVLALLGVLVFLILRQRRKKVVDPPIANTYDMHNFQHQPEYAHPGMAFSPPGQTGSPTLMSESMRATPKLYK